MESWKKSETNKQWRLPALAPSSHCGRSIITLRSLHHHDVPRLHICHRGRHPDLRERQTSSSAVSVAGPGLHCAYRHRGLRSLRRRHRGLRSLPRHPGRNREPENRTGRRIAPRLRFTPDPIDPAEAPQKRKAGAWWVGLRTMRRDAVARAQLREHLGASPT